MLRYGSGILAVLASALLPVGSAPAQTVPAQSSDRVSISSWPPVTRMADLGPRQFSAERSGVFAGHQMHYHAELSEFLVHDRIGKLASSMFATSYISMPGATAARPVLFLFNGGPGGSSNTLMFGAAGPQRLAKFDPAAMADPATPLVANDDTILDTADLVFIDAPETGFGRPLPGTDPKTFRSCDGDSDAFAQVILRWLHDHDRMASPIFLAGESYGTIRAVLLARDLRAATPRIDLAGIVLISEALLYSGPDGGAARHVNDPVKALTALPDIAALSWYFGLIDNKKQTLEQAVAAARSFALHDYASAMLAGNRLAETEKAHVAQRLSQITGVPAQVWLDKGLRLDNVRRELLASRNLALGQFDGRQTEPLKGIVSDNDRDFKGMMRALTKSSEGQAQNVFHATALPDYFSIVPDPIGLDRSWTYIAPPAPGPDLILREQMAANSRLRLMVTQGVFDTTTPMGETDYLFSQIGAPRDRTSIAYYPGGHMLYSDDAGRRDFLEDLRSFVSGRPTPPRAFPQPPAVQAPQS
jgi:carboxypeptidase C (cathepsin A)